MPVTLVQKQGGQTTASAASLAVTLGSAPVAGNLLVACCNSDATVATPTGFSLAVSAVSGQGLYIFYRVVLPADSATVTFTPSVSDSVAAGVIEYAGLVTASVLDKTASANTGSSTSLATGTTATTAQANELLIVCGGPHNSTGGTPFTFTSWSAGYTNQVSQPNGVGGNFANVGCFIGDQVVSATGAYAATVTWGTTANDAGAAIATFKVSLVRPPREPFRQAVQRAAVW
jgi:hypothetical protein